MTEPAPLDAWLAGLAFTQALSQRAREPGLAVRVRPGFSAYEAFDPAVRRFDRRSVHFVDAPDDVAPSPSTPIWSWWVDDAEPAAVLDLTCKVPADDPPSHELFVCTAVRWQEVRVGWRGREVALPLAPDHLLLQATCVDGDAADPAMRLDGSMALLFAYALGEGGAEPVGPGLLAAGQGDVVMVAVEFLTGRAARGVDPWGLALVAPLHPRLTVGATCALDGLAATLVLERGGATTMVGCTADDEGRFRARAAAAFQTTWAAFANRGPALESLGWDRLYDDVCAGDRGVVAAAAGAPPARERGGRVVLRDLDLARVPPGAAFAPSEAWAVTAPELHRVARQGSHDAVVIAPALVPTADVLRDAALRWWRLDEIAPLPLGCHDALHVVWRWPGRAPDVPEQQDVRVESDGGTVRYRAARAARLEPGAREVVFAHGAFFGLALDTNAWNESLLARAWSMPDALSRRSGEPWLRHWIGRYCVAGAQGPTERFSRSPAVGNAP
ncbi:MAG: hypothetical protein U0324_33985 [Polyangiales bacterium]